MRDVVVADSPDDISDVYNAVVDVLHNPLSQHFLEVYGDVDRAVGDAETEAKALADELVQVLLKGACDPT